MWISCSVKTIMWYLEHVAYLYLARLQGAAVPIPMCGFPVPTQRGDFPCITPMFTCIVTVTAFGGTESMCCRKEVDACS